MSRDGKPEKIQVNDIGEKGRASLKSRVIVGLILTAIFVPCLILGGWFWLIIISACAALAIYEIIKCPNKPYRWYIYLLTYVATMSYIYWFLIKCNGQEYIALKALGQESTFTPSLEEYSSNLWISLYGIAASLGLYFFIAILHDEFTLQDVCYFFLVTLLLGFGFQAIIFLRYYPGYIFGRDGGFDITSPLFRFWVSAEFVIFVFGTTIFNDIWAYFVGVFFGKHHMNPRVSPKKTWEGFFGGWFLGSATGIAFALIADACGYPILPFLGIDHWYYVVIMGLLIPLFGDLGDFSFSLIKRAFGTKDYGTIFRAHGGVLDRADSLIFSSIGCAVIVIFMENSFNFFK